MKTTVEIADSLLSEAKALASRRGITLRQLIEEGLRISLRQYRNRRGRFQLEDGSVGGEGLNENYSWPQLRAFIYEGRGE